MQSVVEAGSGFPRSEGAERLVAFFKASMIGRRAARVVINAISYTIAGAASMVAETRGMRERTHQTAKTMTEGTKRLRRKDASKST